MADKMSRLGLLRAALSRKPAAALGLKSWETRLLKTRLDSDYTTNDYDDADEQIAAAKSVSWVYACCRIIGESFSKVDWWFEDDKKNIVEVPELRRLLHRPNRYMSGRDLFEGTMWHLLLTGEAYWYLGGMDALSMFRAKGGIVELDKDYALIPKVPGRPLAGAVPKEVWLLQPECVKPKAGGPGVLYDKFVYEPSARNIYDIPADAVIYFKLFHPGSMLDGLGVVEAASNALRLEGDATSYQKAFFRNAAQPSGILKTESDQDDVVERLRTWWQRSHEGVDRTHRVAVLGAGVEWQNAGLSQKDMEFLEGRRFTMLEIAGMFGVPPSKLGQMKDTNKATASEEDKAFWGECLEPKLLRVSDKLSAELVPRFASPDTRFVFEDVTPDDLVQQSQVATQLVGAGIWTINEARERFGWGQKLPGGDVPRVPAMTVTLEEATAPEPEPPSTPPASPTPSEEPAGEPTEPVKQKPAPTPLGKLDVPDAERLSDEKTFARRIKRWQQDTEIDVQRAVRASERLRELAEQYAPEKVAGAKAEGSNLDDDIWAEVSKLVDWSGIEYAGGKAIDEATRQALQRAGAVALAELTVGVGFDPDAPQVVAWLESYVPRLSGAVTEETRRAISDALIAGIKEGEGFPALRERITQVFADAKGYRAEMIARTETQRAYARGQIEAWRQSGVVTGKQWVTSTDPCPDCAAMDGKIIPLDESFVALGDTMPESGRTNEYMGIEGADAHPNCQCDLVPV